MCVCVCVCVCVCSERLRKAGDQVDPQETAAINRSLSALHGVMAALVDPATTYVHYRGSKLTLLLQVDS